MFFLRKYFKNCSRASVRRTLDEYTYGKGKIGRTWGGDPHHDPRKDRFYREWVRILANQP
jgi:hypothetical protein